MKNKYFLKEEQHHLQQSIFTFFKGSFLLFFLLFSISLSSSNIALAQSIRLALGEYECTTDNDCEADEYCGIDDHVCKKLPTCNPDEICTDETCNPEEICPQPEDREGCDSNADCTDSSKPFCVNRSCVACTGDADCPQDPPRFCIENACRLGCTSNDECTEEAAPRCNTQWGKCMPCPDDKPYLDKNTWECSESCETSNDCKDERRPYCRKENGAQLGTCGCPDKTTYSEEWQTCVYYHDAHLHGGKGRGYKGSPWSGGGSSGDTPFVDAEYVAMWVDCSLAGTFILKKNGTRVMYSQCAYPVSFVPGDTFKFELHNGRKKQDSRVVGSLFFIYKPGFKLWTGARCVGDSPIMKSDGRCVPCHAIDDGMEVAEAYHCSVCEPGVFYSAHSKKGGTDNLCRSCDNASKYYYADQEQCLKCPNRFHRSYDTYCFSCNYASGIINTTKEECTRCPNRRWKETNATTHLGTCYLCESGSEVDTSGGVCSQCDEEHPVQRADVEGYGCWTCEEFEAASSKYVKTADDCHKCGEGWYSTFYSSTYPNKCQACASGTAEYTAEKEECLTCSNTFWLQSTGKCYDCASTDNITGATEDECHSCQDPSVRFVGTNGTCYDCADTSSTGIESTKKECLRCSNRYWNESSGKCIPCKAGAHHTEDGASCECNPDEVMDDAGKCFTCDTLVSGDVINPETKEQCIACGFTYKSKNKTCMNCDVSIGDISDMLKSECDACMTERAWVQTNASTGLGKCFTCPAGTEADAEYDVSDNNNTNLDDEYADTDGLNCYCRYGYPVARADRNDNGCWSCEEFEEASYKYVETPEDCHRCGRDLWYSTYYDSSHPNTCRPCSSGSSYYTATDTECLSCSNTIWRSHDGKCFDSVYNGGETGKISNLTPEECHLRGNRFMNTSNGCYWCKRSSTYTTTHEECLRCTERYWVAGSNGTTGSCKLCASGSATNNGTACGCVEADQVTTTTGKCVVCSAMTEGTVALSAQECHKCSGWLATTENKCYKCDTQYVYNTTSDECHSCSAHLWRSSDGTCYTCSYPYKMYNTTKDECERCSGRVWEEVSDGIGFCHPPVEE